MTRISVSKMIKQYERRTGKKIKLKPYYSRKLRKWTVRAVEQ